jgi:hypothetical protein
MDFIVHEIIKQLYPDAIRAVSRTVIKDGELWYQCAFVARRIKHFMSPIGTFYVSAPADLASMGCSHQTNDEKLEWIEKLVTKQIQDQTAALVEAGCL